MGFSIINYLNVFISRYFYNYRMVINSVLSLIEGSLNYKDYFTKQYILIRTRFRNLEF